MGKKTDEIKTLIRVQSWTVDEQRRVLSQLQGREESLIADCAHLDRQLLHEQQVAAADPTMAGQAYVAYARNNRIQHANLQTVITALRVEIEQQREVLAETYRELKTLEEVEKKWLEAERKEAARIEQNNLDEIAQNLHRRQQALETA